MRKDEVVRMVGFKDGLQKALEAIYLAHHSPAWMEDISDISLFHLIGQLPRPCALLHSTNWRH